MNVASGLPEVPVYPANCTRSTLPDRTSLRASFTNIDHAAIKGHEHGAKGEEEVWEEFVNDPESLAFESEQLRADLLGEPVEDVAQIDLRDLPAEGIEREALVRIRVNQSFFRRRIVSAYESRCCVTGLAVPELLVASHIIPWAEDIPNRLNPRNGLCLNALHDRAFDRGLMWIDDGFVIRFSKRLRARPTKTEPTLGWLTGFDGQALQLPTRFSPDPTLLRQHAGRNSD